MNNWFWRNFIKFGILIAAFKIPQPFEQLVSPALSILFLNQNQKQLRTSLSLVTMALVFFCTSCSNEKAENTGGLSATAQKNLDAFHAVDSAFQTGDISRIDDLVASDFVDHTDKGDMGRDSLKAMITAMKNSGTMKSEIKKEFADDEYVMGWMHWSGTSNVSMPGMPAGPYDITAIETVRFKDGKAVEHWFFIEPREIMKMMATMQTTNPTSTDKAK